MKHLIAFLFLFVSFLGIAQNPPLEPVSWNASYKDISATEGEIIFTANIAENWHTYSQRPTEDGPVPTSFTVSASNDFQLNGKVEESKAHEEYVKAFEAKVYIFDKEAVFTQKVKRLNEKAFSIKAYVEFMSCNDVMCNPPKIVPFTVEIPAVKK